MVDFRFLLASIFIILLSCNITQYVINYALKDKLSLQNSAILQEKKEQDKLIKQRDADLKKLSVEYKSNLAAIKSLDIKNDLTCQETLDLILVSMQQVDGMPDNP